VQVGGKTGTGDHRFDVFGKGGQIVSSRVVTRTGTLVFYIGDRFFGTMMAYVHEPYAANYKFTSAMPAQLLKALVPSLLPLLNESRGCGAAGHTDPADASQLVLTPAATPGNAKLAPSDDAHEEPKQATNIRPATVDVRASAAQ
jgi:hypothetical protein